MRVFQEEAVSSGGTGDGSAGLMLVGFVPVEMEPTSNE